MNTQDWLLPETTVRFDELPLEYNGFCGYTFVTKDGLLLPGVLPITHKIEGVKREGCNINLFCLICSQGIHTSAF